MQVRACHATCRAYFPDDLARLHDVPWLHVDGAHVAIHRDEPFTVIEKHRVAIEEVVACVDDAAVRGSFDRGTGWARDVHAGVRVARLIVEYAP